MASFEERSISSKVDSSDAETNKNSSEKLQFSCLNVENSELNANIANKLTTTDHLLTMENVIVQNRVHLQSATNDIYSDTSSGQTDCNSNSNHGNFEAENIVSSTQETTNDSFNVKLNSDNINSMVNKCDITDVKSQLPKSMANEKHTINEQSHVAVTASALSSQNRKMMNDEPKRHLHISDSSKAKSKSLNSGSYNCYIFQNQ